MTIATLSLILITVCLLTGQLNAPEEFNKVMAGDFARFVNRLHQKGIIDIDLNAGNVLYQPQADGHYTFSLIDINRMKFYHWLSTDEGMCGKPDEIHRQNGCLRVCSP